MLKLNKRVYLTKEYTQKANLTELFGKEDLSAIGEFVAAGYTKDKDSRSEWEKRTEAALNLALQVTKSKNFPWPNCSNIAFPLVTIAALQFHSQAYPAIFQGPELVKYRLDGLDPTGAIKQRGDLLSAHMSHQLDYEDRAWEEQHDRALLVIPIIGCAFMKSYHSAAVRQNRSELVIAHDLVMDYFAKSVESCKRKTHRYPLYRNDIYEKCMAGVFKNVLDEQWYQSDAPIVQDSHVIAEDKRKGVQPPTPDEDTPFWGLECHCLMDLDGDGYKEPYVVTIEETSREVLRIVTRFEWDDVSRLSNGKIISIRATEYFTKYGFIPSPHGSVYDLGFGILLGPLNESTNSIINQLVDAGTMANAGGGFLARGAKMRGGQYSMSPLEWRPVDTSGDDLRKSVFPLPVREPSEVLLKLLTLLIEYAGRIPGTTETMVGENPGQNTPASTTQTMVQQGMKVYKSIFKRVWRSMREELEKLYLLNSVFLSPEPIPFGDKGLEIQRHDYQQMPPTNIMPASDPNVVSESMRFQIATMVKQSAMHTPGYSIEEVERHWLKAMNVDSIGVLYPGVDKVPPLPNPKVQVEQIKMQGKQAELEFEKQTFIATLMEERRLNQAKIVELMAKAALAIEQAGGVKASQEIAAFEAAVGALKAHGDHINKQIEMMMKGQENARQNAGAGGMGGMAGAPNQPAAPQQSAGGMGGGA